MSERSKSCRYCEWFNDSLSMSCLFEPEPITIYNNNKKACGRFQWNAESMQEMLRESEEGFIGILI